jgi:hypothetical protein
MLADAGSVRRGRDGGPGPGMVAWNLARTQAG